MRFVAVEMLQSNDTICVPRTDEMAQGKPGAFDMLQILTVELGDAKLGFELRILATNISTSEKIGLRIPIGGYVLSPDPGEIVSPEGGQTVQAA